MKKFFVVYKATPEEFQKMMAHSTPEQQKAGMEEWKKWMDSHKADLVDMGAPLGKTKEVSKGGVVKDIRNDIGGYSIVQAQSHDAAAKIFADSPHFSMMGGTVEVMEIAEMPM